MRRFLVLFVPLLLVVGAAACGDDDSSGGGLVPGADGGGSDSGGDSGGDGGLVPGGDDGGITPGGGGDFCELAASYADDADLQNFNPNDPNALDTALAALQQLENAAPDEIADDLTLLVDAFEQLVDIDFSDPDAVDDLSTIGTRIEEAAANVDAYLTDVCGIDTTPT
jgi:hypothetical protein